MLYKTLNSFNIIRKRNNIIGSCGTAQFTTGNILTSSIRLRQSKRAFTLNETKWNEREKKKTVVPMNDKRRRVSYGFGYCKEYRHVRKGLGNQHLSPIYWRTQTTPLTHAQWKTFSHRMFWKDIPVVRQCSGGCNLFMPMILCSNNLFQYLLTIGRCTRKPNAHHILRNCEHGIRSLIQFLISYY